MYEHLPNIGHHGLVENLVPWLQIARQGRLSGDPDAKSADLIGAGMKT
jgi:hypothetical protein